MFVPLRHGIDASIRVAALLALLVASLAACGSSDPVAQARELQRDGRFEESLAPLREQLDERPDDPEAQYLYGHALVQTRQISLAQFALRKAMESPDWLVPAALELAAAEILTDNAEGAVEVSTRILEVEPDHLDGLLLRARAQVMTRQGYEPALADAERVIELDPGNFEASMLRTVSLLGLDRIEEADAALAELESTAPEMDLGPDDSARFCAMRALFARERGEMETAESRFDTCLETYPADFLVVKEALEFFDGRQRPERSLEILRAGLVEAPTAGVFRRALADRLRRQGEVADAERTLLDGTELENPFLAAESWVDLGNHHHALGDYSAAASALGRAVEIQGEHDPQLLFDYADALVMAERHDEALEIARRMEVSPHRDLVMGRVALDQGQAAEALEHFAAALLLWPDNEVARYYAALAAERTGDFDRAIAEYRYSIRGDPMSTDARVRLARLYEAEGEEELALSVLYHDTGRNPAGPDAEILAARVTARLGRARQLRSVLAGLARRGALGPSIAAAAEGARVRLGPAAAADWVLAVDRLDLTDPRSADALRVLVACLDEADRSGEAVELTRKALAKHPEAAVFHAIHADALRASGAPAEEVRAAYLRALELDPDHSAAAQIGLARLAAEAGDADVALDYYARAAANQPDDATALFASAELLISLERRPEAERQLEQALERDPYDDRSAARLAALLLERSADLDRALELAQRSARFGGGSTAEALVARVRERRGESEPASDAAAAPEPRGR
jgi:tetratricopeptide (TPR) repeat protein